MLLVTQRSQLRRSVNSTAGETSPSATMRRDRRNMPVRHPSPTGLHYKWLNCVCGEFFLCLCCCRCSVVMGMLRWRSFNSKQIFLTWAVGLLPDWDREVKALSCISVEVPENLQWHPRVPEPWSLRWCPPMCGRCDDVSVWKSSCRWEVSVWGANSSSQGHCNRFMVYKASHCAPPWKGNHSWGLEGDWHRGLTARFQWRKEHSRGCFTLRHSTIMYYHYIK